MPPRLPQKTKFEVPATGKHKYVALVPSREGKITRVRFGHRDYQQYRDQVPSRMGGGKWKHMDHRDEDRRRAYRRRHGAQRCANGELCYQRRYTPAWFSYYFLW